MQIIAIFVSIAVLQTLLLLFFKGMALTIIDISLVLTLLILIYRRLGELAGRLDPDRVVHRQRQEQPAARSGRG